MKIALLSYEYPSETGFGGIGTYTWYQARALARLGHDVHVLAGATSPTPLRTTDHDGVQVHRYRADGVLMRGFERLDGFKMWWSKARLQTGLSMYRGLADLVERHRFDVVEMPECGAEGLFVNFLIDAPTVVRFHSPARLIMQYYDVVGRDVALCSALERIAMAGARTFSSCSAFLANEVRDTLGMRRPVRVIPNGIDLQLFDTGTDVDVRSAAGVPKDRPIVLFTGRIEPRKGIELVPDIVLKTLAKHEVSFVFAGRDPDGWMSRVLLPQVERHPLRGSVHYLGGLDLAAVRAWLRTADIFLLPSVWENCPYSCLEAMAAGLAIVSSNQGGMPELIEDGVDGLLATSGVSSSFVDQLDRVLQDSSLRSRLGRAARLSVETSFTDVSVAERSVAFYREAAR